jgi:hypothetical protein
VTWRPHCWSRKFPMPLPFGKSKTRILTQTCSAFNSKLDMLSVSDLFRHQDWSPRRHSAQARRNTFHMILCARTVLMRALRARAWPTQHYCALALGPSLAAVRLPGPAALQICIFSSTNSNKLPYSAWRRGTMHLLLCIERFGGAQSAGPAWRRSMRPWRQGQM